MNTTVGSVLQDKYVIRELIGEGGMGSVYIAREAENKPPVALKLMNLLCIEDEENVKRFRREAKILAKLSHKNIVSFYEFGVSDQGLPYTVMELLSGDSLREILNKEGRLDPLRSVQILKQACEGLAYAHHLGVLHRDLTPGNIVLLEGEEPRTVKIVDFGLVKLTEKSGLATEKLTKTGLLVGSLHYMSPEQSRGMQVDARTDIYAAGCILYEMLTGEKPFDADNPVGLLFKQCNEEARPFADIEGATEIPEQYESVCRKAMQKSADKRYQSMVDFIHDLEVLSNGNGKLLAEGVTSYGASGASTFNPGEPVAQTKNDGKKLKGVLVFVAGFLTAILLVPFIMSQLVKTLPEEQQMVVEIAKQQMVPFNGKMWIQEDAAQVGPKVDCTVLQQDNPHTGMWSVYLSKNGMITENRKMACCLVTSAPDWNVVMYNCKTRCYFLSPLSEWKGASLKASSSKNAAKQAAYRSMLVEKKPKVLREGTILGHPAKQFLTDNLASTGLKKVEFWVTPDVEAPPELKQVFSKIYGVGLSSVEGLPLKVSYIDENGKRTPVFTTTKIEKTQVPSTYFTCPPGYKRVDSEIAVLMDEEGQKRMKAIMEEKQARRAKGEPNVDELLGPAEPKTGTTGAGSVYKSHYTTPDPDPNPAQED